MSFLGASGRKAKRGEMNLELAQLIVSEYGAVLEKNLHGVGGSASEAILPFDKDLIKEALVRVARVPFTNPKQMDLLRGGYMHLASFRSDGGRVSQVVQPGVDIKDQIENHVRMGREGLVKELKQEVRIAGAISAEMNALSEEFDSRAIQIWGEGDA